MVSIGKVPASVPSVRQTSGQTDRATTTAPGSAANRASGNDEHAVAERVPISDVPSAVPSLRHSTLPPAAFLACTIMVPLQSYIPSGATSGSTSAVPAAVPSVRHRPTVVAGSDAPNITCEPKRVSDEGAPAKGLTSDVDASEPSVRSRWDEGPIRSRE